MALTGAFNLLNAAYGHLAPGLRWTCIATNVGLTAFAVVAGVATRATASQYVIVLGLIGGLALLSFVHRGGPNRPP